MHSVLSPCSLLALALALLLSGCLALCVWCGCVAVALTGPLVARLVFQDGQSDRLAFKLRLPVTSLLIGQLEDKQLFADLLAGDQLTARATCVLSEVTDDFNQVRQGLGSACSPRALWQESPGKWCRMQAMSALSGNRSQTS